MFNQLMELEEVITKLEQANSLIDCMSQNYFKSAEPNLEELKNCYSIYANIINIISNITTEQQESLTGMLHSILKLRSELKETTERTVKLVSYTSSDSNG